MSVLVFCFFLTGFQGFLLNKKPYFPCTVYLNELFCKICRGIEMAKRFHISVVLK